jgi:hypothetical protein
VKLVPGRVITHLGLVVDFLFPGGRFRVPKESERAFKELVSSVLRRSDRRVAVRVLAKIAGRMQSFKLALGPVVSFFTRYLYIAIEQATSWGQWVVLGQEAWQELLKLVALNFDEMVQLVWRPLTWATVDVEPEMSVEALGTMFQGQGLQSGLLEHGDGGTGCLTVGFKSLR